MVRTVNAIYPISHASAIVDLGCGPGQVMTELLSSYSSDLPPSARVVAADLAPGMIEMVTKKKVEEVAQGNNAWNKVETAIWDATDLSDVPDGSFSHVLSGFVYFLLPNARKGLEEARRILSTDNGGGIFATSSMGDTEWGYLTTFIKQVRPDKVIPSPSGQWKSVEGVRAELEAAGFRNVKAHSVPLYMPFETQAELVHHLVSTIPLMKKLTADMTSDEVSQAKDLMVQFITEKHPTAPGFLDGTAIIGLGRK